MGEVVTLRECEGLQAWKCAFVTMLLSLCPDVNPDLADEASDVEFCEGLDPALAATHWAARQGPPPPLHVGTHPEWHPFDADVA